MLQFEPIWAEIVQIQNSFLLDQNHRLSLLRRDCEGIIDDFLQFRDEYFLSSLLYADAISEIVTQDPSIDFTYRYKEQPSILRNWHKTNNSTQRLKKVFNDLLGFRFVYKVTNAELDTIVDQFVSLCPADFECRKVPLQNEGYQGIHLYIHKDNYSFPIEIQFWTRTDALLNRYLRDNIYTRDLGEDIKNYAQELRVWLEQVPLCPATTEILAYVDYIYERAFVSTLMIDEEEPLDE